MTIGEIIKEKDIETYNKLMQIANGDKYEAKKKEKKKI